jgi:phosphoglycolate phosphatase
LLDTIDDLADSMNLALADSGFPIYDTEFYKIAVGDGLPKLVERVIPEAHRDENTIKRCISGMEAEYKKSWNRKTRPYDGIVELLDSLVKHQVRMNVLSNKLEEYTQLAVDFYFPQFPFEQVMGASPSVPRKPDPQCALFIAKKLNVDPQNVVFLGDTNTDMKTAVAAGMFPVGALWGFRNRSELEESGAEAVLSHPLELLDYFD